VAPAATLEITDLSQCHGKRPPPKGKK
jgi:hypothetical protein